MKIYKSYFLLIIVCLAFIVSATCQANEIEKKFIEAGLVNIHVIDESIKVDLVNSDPGKNYFRENYYDGLHKAYLRREVAQKLSLAQKHLKSEFPEYSILIMDAARPRAVSKLMFEKMKGTKFEKYVANPKNGSMHNYGIAVDVSIVDANGQEIDMGFTPFYKSDLSIYWGFAKLKMLDLSKAQKKNRKLLSDVMKKAGFIPLSYEWWHFDGMPKDEARKKYQIIE
ncbi:MAG: D-alanyl-D-alanine dipeptidase [Desulfobacteraceae bacterium]|nr:MAG: D-alanyl-D-alanine dipeptidase [Desulfobacteraceae bacterium]